ncbi:hypothetical protein MHU86_3543 [Fragilaria crotonensis]|nr:hypothetical protein MHU86_3543 [Fragilaria crotonensis]
MNSLLRTHSCKTALPIARGVLWQQLSGKAPRRTAFGQSCRGNATDSVSAQLGVRRRKIEQVNKGKIRNQEYPYGLNPVDYSKPPPIAPMLIPPPPKPGLQQLLNPLMFLICVGFGIYIYYNNDPETYEYWKRVESGAILLDDDDDDEDDDDDDDDDDES